MNAARGRTDGIVVFVSALAARLAMVAWAAPRFPPAADGQYYHTLAMRLASGAGYTWQWPDGAVTAAAHYPVGYPALLAAFYAVLGPRASVAMTLGAVLGALGALAAYALAKPWGRPAALASGLAVALHPALVPYAAALMTEVIASSGLLGAAALVATMRDEVAPSRARVRLVLAAIALGVTTLVRPQCIVLAPVLGFFAPGRAALARKIKAAALVSAVALAVCLPWTARNCHAMKRCALVSVNGGWNLLIGTQTTSGAWQPIDVPDGCKTVWDEAQKDACFEREARAALLRDPVAALARMPAKLAVTFDYFGGAPWYLHESNAAAFDDDAKVALGTADAVSSRVLLIAALVALARRGWSVRRSTAVRALLAALALASLAFAVSRHAAPAYVGFVALAALSGPYDRSELLVPWSAAVVASVALTHAVFFGAGRYGLVVAPFVAAVGATVLARGRAASTEPAVTVATT